MSSRAVGSGVVGVAGAPQRSAARRRVGAALLFVGLGGCSGGASGPMFSSIQQDIFGGAVDTEHPAVMLLFDQTGLLCSGTNLKSSGGRGFLLTAAHCVTTPSGRGFTEVPPERLLVVPGGDFSQSTLAYGVEAVHVPPTYDAAFGGDDIAIVRFVYADEPEPASLAPISAADDDLGIGDPLLLVGFGETEAGPGNTQRRRVQRDVAALGAEVVLFSQADGRGACSGDSGGPGLIRVDGAEQVALVISSGIDFSGSPCEGGVTLGTRVSAYEDFILEVLEGFAACDACLEAAAPACESRLSACVADGTCGAYLGCDAGCTSDACRVNCALANPEGYLGVRGYVACNCQACGPCAPGLGCDVPECGFAEPAELCPCVAADCCQAAKACQADPVCEACISFAGFDVGCADSALLQELSACLDGCADECAGP